jgi:membrane protease YdiL (CAAX protease family)
VLALFEPLLIYLVLFFPGFSPGAGLSDVSKEPILFSTVQELNRILSYTLPALALLWYLILEKKILPLSTRKLKPSPGDAYSFFWGFPGLVLIGLGISLSITWLAPFSAPARVPAPATIPGWIVMVCSCLGTGYLEESYFRLYLLRKLEKWVSFRVPRIAFSVLLFAFCHAYEGLGGILNAVLAGILLSILFERYRSLHGIAIAHACYNVFVYTMGHFL